MGGYDWNDMWSTSYNEKKRNEYKKAVDKLSGYKFRLYSSIKTAESSLDGFSSVYDDSSELYGDIINSFYTKSENLNTSLNGYISRLWSVYSEVSSRLDIAQGLYNDYYYACIREDEEGRRKWEENN